MANTAMATAALAVISIEAMRSKFMATSVN
jgi:hypothetical protein